MNTSQGIRDRLLERFARELRDQYGCHTVILYGSRARGTASAASDYDLIGFRRTGAVIHEARKAHGKYLDAFICPDQRTRPSALVRVRGGRVLFQKGQFGSRFLARVERAYARGPKPIDIREARVRKLWAKKMLDRARQGDAEGNFRRIWLLTSLLEDYFALRGRWYEGPNASFIWLRQHQPSISALFDKALKPDADLTSIATLAEAVLAVRAKLT